MGSQTQKLSYHLVAPQSESVGDSQFVYEMVPPMLHPRSVKILGIERVGFKALLIINNASGSSESVCCKDENVQVVFFISKYHLNASAP